MKVQANYSISMMQEAIAKGKTFYQFFKIRRPWRDYQVTDKTAFCPLCEMQTRLVIIGMLNNKYKKENWLRCENCLIKLPSLMAEKLAKQKAKNKALDNRITNFVTT